MLVYNVETRPPIGVLSKPHDSSDVKSSITSERNYSDKTLNRQSKDFSSVTFSTLKAKLIETKLKQSDLSRWTCSILEGSVRPKGVTLQPSMNLSAGISFITANKPDTVTKTSSLSAHIPDVSKSLQATVSAPYDSVLEFRVASKMKPEIRVSPTSPSLELSVLNCIVKPKADNHAPLFIPTFQGEGHSDLFFYIEKRDLSPRVRVESMTKVPPSLYAKIIKDKKENIVIGENVSELSASIIESNIGTGGNGGIGDLKIVLEVLRGKIYYFQFPDGYLQNMLPSGVATALNKTTLKVRTENYGDVTLYTDKGEIVLRTVPGLRVE
ncbi:hypothetical protein C3I27_03275 [Campylobacter jejuni]|uniref:Uncharacterized protein n=1 Tax=Campylobacter jejuni TaxID=197 RepID=A0AAX1Z4F4_CAMJU|nr:hypothetical protein [Campylobacter jejuni]RTI48447.1 hypothetical protein C3I27_03275 [Campylobacter jejuni]